MTRAVFLVRLIDRDEGHVFITDECDSVPTGAKSVTNDAEDVCRVLFGRFGNVRFFYRDTMNNWDELVHDKGRFTKFLPARALAAKAGLA